MESNLSRYLDLDLRVAYLNCESDWIDDFVIDLDLDLI